MLEELKKEVCEANLELVRKGIVIYTWGNVSGISEDRKYMVIKPSGVDYDGIYAVNGAGIRIQPAETDPDTGTVVFPYPEEAWDVYIPDHIGNTLHLALKFE